MLLFYVDDTGVAEEELQPGCRFIKEEGKVVLGDWSPGDRGPNRQTGDLGPAWRLGPGAQIARAPIAACQNHGGDLGSNCLLVEP